MWHVGPAILKWWSVRESRSALQICSPSPSLAADFLLVCIEENRIWLLHSLEKGQVFTGLEGMEEVGGRSSLSGHPGRAGSCGAAVSLPGRTQHTALPSLPHGLA